MALDLSPRGLAGRSARRPWVVVGAWALTLVISMALIVILIGDSLTTDVGLTGEPESREANSLIRERFRVPGESTETEIILVSSQELTVDEPAFQEFVEKLYSDFIGLGPGLVKGGTHYYLSDEERLVTLDRHTAGVVLTLGRGENFWDRYFEVFRNRGEDQFRSQSDDGFRVHAVNSAGPGDGDIVVVRSVDLTVDHPDYRKFVEDLTLEIVSLGRNVVWGAGSYYQTGEEAMVSADLQATLIVVRINDFGLVDRVHDVIHEAGRNEGFDVSMTGSATLDHDFLEISADDLRTGELMFGLPMAIVVLILVFGALVAAAVPIVLAIVSIIVALGLSMVVGQFMTVSIFLVNMVFMMGLAVEVDYSLFIVARFREERAQGASKVDAIQTAGATAGQAVLFSGVTVLFALFGLMLIGHDIFISLGLGAILVVLTAIVSSLTLLPALVSILGDRVNALRLPYFYALQSRAVAESSGGMWDVIVRVVTRAPAVSVVLAGGVLIAAALPLLDINIGVAGVSSFPDSFESKKGYLALERDFSAGLAEPIEIVVDGPADADDVQAGIQRLKRALSDDAAFGAVEERVSPRGDLVQLTVPVAGGDATSEAAMSAVKRLRQTYIPAAFNGTQARGLVTGHTAGELDYINVARGGLAIVIPFVLVLSFLLLTLVFRSLVVPVKAIIMNLLSVGAAYGLLVLVFQKGVGADLLGFQEVDTIEAWVPAFLFAVLFGLSMDYHVFLISRIRERFDETGDNAEAVAYGIRSTGRLITGAALIMVAVFIGFASGDLVMFQQMGFGLAVAVLLDATIVRSVLVPASMHMLGRANWYLPAWLDWLPRFRPDGARKKSSPFSPGGEG
jgi:RND superfamily putative drug exporter